jgi:hypothetical protein
MVLVCANAAAGISMRHAAAIIGRAKLRMRSSLQEVTSGFPIAVAKNCRFHALNQLRATVRSVECDFNRQLQLNFASSKIPYHRFSKLLGDDVTAQAQLCSRIVFEITNEHRGHAPQA